MRPQIRKVPPPRAEQDGKTSVRVVDLMRRPAVTTVPHATVQHVRKILRSHGFHCLPVVDPDRQALGIVTTADMLDEVSDATPVSQVMTRDVLTVPQYEEPAIAARIMRNHGVHHLVVTHEKEVVGMISSFDLLRLVENHAYVARQRSGGKGRGGRKRAES